jgi:hypothetical protein
MRSGFLIFVLVMLVAGCGNKNGVPSGIIPQQKMQLVLWDMMRADQFLADYVLNRDTSLKKETESFKLYQQVFAIHKISKDEFQRSLSYYTEHPLLFKAIMDSISAPVDAPSKMIQPEVTTPVQYDTPAKTRVQEIPDTGLPKRKRPVVPYQ